ncbi:MAG: 50S ribosomal protein L10 [Desulfobacterales bacterium]|nr:50S ribosomal protein L10 [Desulfobacterales bacterium]
MKLENKKQIVAQLKDKFGQAKLVILTDYKGLNVAAMNDLRAKLREAGIDYHVAKNTLLRRAAQDTDAAALIDSFTGPSAIAVSLDDPVAPAKVLTEFAKANEKLEIKAGVMEGKILDASSIKALASLPSREVLLANLLSVLVAVPTGMVTVLNEIPAKFVRVLAAVRDQKEAA